ncbi:MAG: putative LPS assembly protein LptD [Candidatus Saccharicenans sp.]|jgi:lipopolysaccharide assembly outer membrane protein LptD (OstA)|nr:putative LPS assembly protein LptD [Candidatus Saccharicenans sp.]MDH7493566.1 putative LPS assembly protein LptD [Candidatus Saccharicenans sp.]
MPGLKTGVLTTAFLLMFLLPLDLWPECFPDSKQDSSQRSEEVIQLAARYQEKNGPVWLATGEVELRFGALTLLADRLQVNSETYEVVAEGQVTLQLPSEVITCESLLYNLKTGEGRLEGVRAISRPGLLFGAGTIEKSATDLYRLEKAWFTTCTQPVPRWCFSLARASLKPEDYVSLRQAVFRIKNLPLLYLPYLRYPLKERATGFLFPRLGFNRIKGFSLSQSFYWALAPNLDATLSADFYSKKGTGLGLEYRYLLPAGTRGEASAYLFFFRQEEGGERPRPAFILRLNHRQTLPAGFQLTGQADYSSSFNFLREFDNNFTTATVNNRSYQINLSRSWSYFNFNLRTSRFESYFPQTGQSVSTTYLPQASFNLLQYRLQPFLYLSFESGLNNWKYSWKTELSEQAYTLGQAYFRPVLSCPLLPADWLNLNLSAAGNFTYYFQSYEPGSTARSSKPLLTSQARLGLQLEGPVLYRVYFSQGQPYLKHLLVPFLSFSYDTPLSRETLDRIISPFGIFRNNDLKFGLMQHWLKRTEGSPREILTIGVAETVFFDPEHSPTRYYYPQEPGRHFSPVNAYLRYYPGGRFSLDISADFNPYEKNFLSSRLTANLGQPDDSFFFRLNWSRNYQVLSPDSIFRSHQAGLQAGWRWPERLDLKTQVEFDLQNRKVLYTALAGIYHYQCLDFSFDLRVFYYRSQPEAQFRFSIGLGNISRSSELLGALGF